MAIIRAEAPNPELPLKFLTVLIEKVRTQGIQGSEILGPIPAAMEKKAGRYRAQMAITAQSRMVLAATVKSFVETSSDIPMRRKVRWAIDIDPHDTI
jgi:primosomal protein N' (replication factor Y)